MKKTIFGILTLMISLHAHAVDREEHLGAGYVCDLRDPIDMTYKQMKMYLVDLNFASDDESVQQDFEKATVIVDGSMLFPTRTLIRTNDAEIKYGTAGMTVHAKGINELMGLFIFKGRTAQFRGTFNQGEVVGECTYSNDVVRAWDPTV